MAVARLSNGWGYLLLMVSFITIGDKCDYKRGCRIWSDPHAAL